MQRGKKGGTIGGGDTVGGLFRIVGKIHPEGRTKRSEVGEMGGEVTRGKEQVDIVEENSGIWGLLRELRKGCPVGCRKNRESWEGKGGAGEKRIKKAPGKGKGIS